MDDVRDILRPAMSAWVRRLADLTSHFNRFASKRALQSRTSADIPLTTSYIDGHLSSYFDRYRAESSYFRGHRAEKDRISVDVRTNSIEPHCMRVTLFKADPKVGRNGNG